MDADLHAQLVRDNKLHLVRPITLNPNRKPGTDLCPVIPMTGARTMAARRALRQAEMQRTSLPMPKRTSF